MDSFWKLIGEGVSRSYSAYNDTILSFGRYEWTIVLIFVAVWGGMCMRGYGKRL